MTEEAREALILERLEAHDPAKQEFLTLPWRDDSERFPVISLELDAAVLSPYSHRIRAQLESHPEAGLVETDPFSDAAQEVIAAILREVGENFEDLKQDLTDAGQQQFGVVTRAGLLVNANRRAVALRDIGKSYIEVAVLPPDTTIAEINDLELTLQMQRDFWEEYTFTNRLLFVDDLITIQSRSVDDVARALNPAVSRDEKTLKKGREQVEQDTRVLNMLREIQRRSEDQIPLTSFDAQEVAFEELERRVHDTATESPGAAEELFQIRLLGILSDVPYRRLRYLDGEVLDDYVIPALAANNLFADVLPVLDLEAVDTEGSDSEDPEGLEVLGESSGEETSPGTPAARQVGALVDLLASSYREKDLTLPTTEGSRDEEREVVRKGLRSALTEAAAEIEVDRRRDSRLLRPVNLAEDAGRKLRAATDAYANVKDDGEFDDIAFREALEQVQGRLDTLSAELNSAD